MNDLLHGFETFSLGQPGWLLLLLLLWPLWRWLREPAPAVTIKFSAVRLLEGFSRPAPARPARAWRGWRIVALVLVICALARPRVERGADEDKTEGIDILLVLDASRSMDSKDFDDGGRKVSRRDALQKVIGEFIKERPRDRIGVIGFAEKPFLISPLTVDHSWMMEALSEVKTSLGTAIGSGIDAGVDLLRRSEGANRVVIVVTDGLNTSGTDPLESARAARRFGIRLYTIGVVSYAEMQTGGLDKVMLSQMARLTGGQFFQAADGSALSAIYRQIDQLERHEFKQAKLRVYRELFPWFTGAALGVIALQAAWRTGRRLRLP